MRYARSCSTSRAWICPPLLLLLAAGSAGAEADSTEAMVLLGRAGPQVLTAEYLESSDATIREIRIHTGDVFDPDDPEEDGALHRMMNTLHIETRDDVIRRQLLVAPGDAFTKTALEEAERDLRKNDFLATAEIVPVRYADGYVDLDVMTEDAWSLTPSLSYSRKGGRNLGGVKIQESNLLGSGAEVKFGYKVGVERDELFFGYRDRQLGSSRYDLGIGGSDNSDGSDYQFLLQQPFYSLDTRNAHGVFVNGFDQLDPLYLQGDVVDQVRHESQRSEAFYGWSHGLENGWVRRFRAGLGYDEHRFTGLPGMPLPPGGLPEDRRDVYPFVGVEWIEDRYETTRNADKMDRIEDRHVGPRYSARIGYASPALGSEDSAWRVGLAASRGLHPTGNGTLMLESAFDGRFASDGEDSYRLGVGAKYYHRQSEKRLFVVELLAETGRAYDTDRIPTLGGDTGLRGYPIAYQSGDSKVVMSLEQRLFTDWYPFHLFRIGAAAFFDAGRTFGGDAGNDLGLLRDVGVGLRIGSPRSSSGRILHVDLAWPMDGPQDIRGAQLVIETRTSF